MSITGIALAILAGSTSVAQSQTAPPQSTTNTPAVLDDHDQICVTVRRVYETFTVQRGPKKMELTLGGGVCGPTANRITDLSLGYATREGMGDFVEAETCPAYRDQITQQWLSPQPYTRSLSGSVKAGPFVIAGRSTLFDLQSSRGRRAAAKWIRETLIAVRPCWDNFRQDQTHYVVDDLYRALDL